jgi:DNA polymerase-1
MKKVEDQCVAYIDADIWIYRMTSSCEEPINWKGDLWTMHCDMGEVKTLIDNAVVDLTERMEATSVVMCFSGPNNFRKKINPEYKRNRATTRKPMCYVPAIKYCKENYTCLTENTLEADDVIGIHTSQESTHDDTVQRVIVSDDKDLLTVPGWHWDDELSGVFYHNEEVANWYFLKQTLTGDTTDNYKGCPKVGPKTAEKILDLNTNDMSILWEAVKQTFIKAGLTEHDAILNARMARILRHGEYKNRKPILWSPYGN